MQVPGERPRVLGAFWQLTIIDATGVMAAQPLGPAVQVEGAADLMTGLLGIADEPKMGFETECGQRLGQPLHAGGETACSRVFVRTLEREYVELQDWFLRLLGEPRCSSAQAR